MDHFIERKIYYHDTDHAGIVYYANYLKYMEEARTEYFYARGVDIKALSESGTLFVVAKVEITYRAPARYFDTIRVVTVAEDVRLSMIRLHQRILREETLIAEARTVIVCVGADMRPKAVPGPEGDALREPR